MHGCGCEFFIKRFDDRKGLGLWLETRAQSNTFLRLVVGVGIWCKKCDSGLSMSWCGYSGMLKLIRAPSMTGPGDWSNSRGQSAIGLDM